MATVMQMDEKIVDCLVLGHNNQDRKVSAKSMTMVAQLFKWLQRIALNKSFRRLNKSFRRHNMSRERVTKQNYHIPSRVRYKSDDF